MNEEQKIWRLYNDGTTEDMNDLGRGVYRCLENKIKPCLKEFYEDGYSIVDLQAMATEVVFEVILDLKLERNFNAIKLLSDEEEQ